MNLLILLEFTMSLPFRKILLSTIVHVKTISSGSYWFSMLNDLGVVLWKQS